MYVLTATLEIAGKRFKRVNEVEIESSAKVLEDVARIRIPATARLVREGRFISEVETAKTFKVGDPVRIHLGYDGLALETFQGYVSRIKPGTPVEIECLDSTWLLRRKNCKGSFKDTTLEKVIRFCLEGTGITLKGNVPTINFTHYYLRNVSAASALQKIKEDYGLTVFLKNNTDLYVGLTSFTDNITVKYGLGQNVIDHDLEWINEEDTRLKVKAVHIRRDNTKVEKEFGDDDGELRTLYFYNIDKGADLEKMARQEVQKYKYSGFKGGLNTFLLPEIAVGNIANVNDPQFAERTGRYLVDKVTTTFSTDGGRRKVELGLKVSA